MDVPINLAQTQIETERLILRPWQEADLNDFYAYASVPGVGEMAGWKPHESIDVSWEVLQMFLAAQDHFALMYKESQKVIGSLGLNKSWANDDPEFSALKLKDIGFVLAKDYWGQGLMAEAVIAVIAFCFDELGLDAVTSGHNPANVQSKRVLEKCGFVYVKTSAYYYEQFDLHTHSMRYVLYKEK